MNRVRFSRIHIKLFLSGLISHHPSLYLLPRQQGFSQGFQGDGFDAGLEAVAFLPVADDEGHVRGTVLYGGEEVGHSG